MEKHIPYEWFLPHNRRQSHQISYKHSRYSHTVTLLLWAEPIFPKDAGERERKD